MTGEGSCVERVVNVNKLKAELRRPVRLAAEIAHITPGMRSHLQDRILPSKMVCVILPQKRPPLEVGDTAARGSAACETAGSWRSGSWAC